MSDAPEKEKTDLSDVMLAMDVVDTLRHEEAVLARELGREDRERELVEKVKKIYASQGIEVSDEVVAEGVAALREERFAYRPPQPGFQHWLARIYVRRGAWAKRGLVALAVLVAGYAAYHFAVVAPQSRGRAKAAQELNLEAGRQQDRIQVARNRADALERALGGAGSSASETAPPSAKALADDARRRLASAREALASLDALPVDGKLASEDVEARGAALRGRLNQRSELIQSAEADLSAAEGAVKGIAQLGALPQTLAQRRDSVLREARTEAARREAESIYADAVAALGRGDVDAAREGAARLERLYDQVVQVYELRIVSRPGEPSGVWREPEDRPGVRNYYLIVEAVTPDGQVLTVPVTSEEDGKTRNVTKWGMRVDADVFEAVRRDKQDDGIIADRLFGGKARGDLLPAYRMPTTGGAITEW